MGRRAKRYFGKVCAKHPTLNGERWRSGHCIDCARDADHRWKAANKARRVAAATLWAKANPQSHRDATRRWSAANPDKAQAKTARRRARKKNAQVALAPADHARISALYAEAARRSAETGEKHHVDHDVPLALGGKHHPDNLLVVPASLNCAKGAHFPSTWDFISS